MSFNRIRAENTWILTSTVAPEEFEQLDKNLSNAIDGKDGGAYSLQRDLVIGGVLGVSITVEKDFICEDDLHANANFFAEDESFFNGRATFNNDVVFSPGGDVFVYGPAQFHQTADFYDDCVFHDYVEFNNASTRARGIFYVDGGTELAGGVIIGESAVVSGPLSAQAATLSGPLSFTAGGYLKKRVRRVTSTLGGVLDPAEHDEALIEASYSGGGGWPVDLTTTGDDAAFTIVTRSTSPVVVSFGTDVGAALCVTPGTTGVLTNVTRAEFRKIAGTWRLFDQVVA